MSAQRSIRRRLLAMLIFTILLVWLLVIVLVYRTALHEVEEVFDADLARSAHILQSLLLHEVEEEQGMTDKVRAVVDEIGVEGIRSYPQLAAILREYLGDEDKGKFEIVGTTGDATPAFVARYGDGTLMMRDRSAPDIPPAPEGYADMELDGQSWRIFSLAEAQTGFVVQVGEKRAVRAELVGYITRNTLTPLLLALPVLGVLIWMVVGRALAPLQRIAHEVSIRAPDALDRIDESDAPREIHGLLTALNKLFGRVRSTIARERQFTADAAHELRTPLAGLKTHLQVARGQSAEPATRASLDRALEGVDRATHSVEQLLMLARADAAQTRALVNATVDLREVAAGVVSSLSQQAFDRNIDLGLDAPGAASVRGDATALQLMLRNLVDNAVRYTPVGGVVTVSVGAGPDGSRVEVVDDGPGVPVAERENIFDRFHRGAGEQAVGANGSGLGLSIVKRVAELHGARITLGEGAGGRGLRVSVRFPG